MPTDMPTDATPRPPRSAEHLRHLYLARSTFAVVWAVVFAVTAARLDLLTATLLVLYPLVDVAAAVVDHRTSGSTRPRGLLVVNIVLSLLAAAGLAVAAASGEAASLRVWGAWAVAAGLVQLVVAVVRRSLGGQWPLILSGAISTVAGAGFIAAAGADDPSLTGLAGYAGLGGVFFLISAVRLRRVPEGSLAAT